jgi:hypothetical protein
MTPGKARSGMNYTQALARVGHLHPLLGTLRREKDEEYHRLLRQFPKLRTLYRRQPKAHSKKN